MARQCTIEGCDNPLYSRGLCNKHYIRNRKFGSPHGGVGGHHAPPEERFWRKVDRSGDCWLWTGSTNKAGYGRFQIGGRNSSFLLSHRYSFELATGQKPPVVMHKCDNPSCVNPNHLEAGTHKENTADMYAKGRARPARTIGDRNFNTKLTPDSVRLIRARKGESANSVGRDFGVDHGTILAIWRGITWIHID